MCGVFRLPDRQAGLYADMRSRQDNLIESITRPMAFPAAGGCDWPHAGCATAGMKK